MYKQKAPENKIKPRLSIGRIKKEIQAKKDEISETGTMELDTASEAPPVGEEDMNDAEI